jgi:tetratricopeptide (TPR) repeat protein
VYELVPGLEPDFHVLEARDFIRRRAGSAIAGETEYAFKHQLTREIAYAGLPKGARSRLHAAFGAWLERFGSGRDEYAALLAHHYAGAVRPEDADLAWAGADQELEETRASAVHWLRRAAELAVGRYDIEDALDLLHHAVELASTDVQVDLWEQIAQANALRYDGRAFWEAMEQAIALTADRTRRGELLSVLASETAVRLGMWRTRPNPQMVKRWVDEALELAEEGTPARVRALLGLAAWRSGGGAAPAQEALALAEELGRIDLIASAGTQLVDAQLASGRYEEAVDEAHSLLRRLDDIRDPDDREGIFWSATLAHLASARIESARGNARLLAETARELTPHHRIHAVGIGLMVEELTGCWEDIRAGTGAAEQAVSENLATPCTMNARSLLVCALAAAMGGDEAGSRRLEEAADALEMEGYGLTIDAPRLRLALMRNDLETAERLLDSGEAMYFGELSAQTARLDTLTRLGKRNRVEQEAVPLLRPNTYLEPFALRALGLMREQENLITQALERFERMGLDWHAAETRALLGAGV